MKPALWIGLFLVMASAWAQPVRRSVDLGRVSRAERSASSRHGMVRARAAAPQAAAPTQAAGVIQTNLLDASNVVWFVTADLLRAGTLLTPFVTFPDGTAMSLDAVTLTQDVAAGTSFDLPNIRNFGYFWPQGLMTYGVTVTSGGKDSQAAADFPVYSARDYNNVTNMVPRVSSTSEFLSSGDVMVSVAGVFASDTPYVLLDDVVVPRSAVRVSPATVTVDLSKVPGLDLSVMRDFLLTVGQSGWCDTAVFRHLPLQPGTYNPAPQ